MALDGNTVFPTTVWDGDSGSRDSDDAIQASPTQHDWTRAIEEIAGLQTRVYNNERGEDDDTIDTVGVIATVTGLTAVESGDAALHKTVLTLDEVEVVTVDGTDPTTDGTFGTTLLYTFPQGHIVVHGGHQAYLITKIAAGSGGISDTADLGIGVGTVAAVQSTEWGLSTTEENICAEADVDLTGGTSDSAESSVNAAVVAADGSAAALSVNLNIRGLGDDDSTPVADILTVSGTITVVWSVIGND